MALLLLATILIPLAGAVLIGMGVPGPRWVALASALAAFGSSALLIAQFPGGVAPYALIECLGWAGPARQSTSA